jgi:predicted ATP-grasp superfamily ATP-dependent carboligase
MSSLAVQSSHRQPVACWPRLQPKAAEGIPKILLLDAYSSRSLACVRSWGKKGVPFALGGERRSDMSLFSRYARDTFLYTSPKRDVSRFVDDVNRYARRFGADYVFPTSEAAIMACSQYQDDLNCIPLIPRRQDIDVVFSKSKTLMLAQSLGITVPKTVHVTAETSRLLDSLSLSFPVAIKSANSEVMLDGRATTSRKTAYPLNRSDLERECRSRLAKGQSVLVQEFIDGYGVGVSGLFSEGVPVALLAHRRIRESDPTGGPSAVAETIELEPHLSNPTVALFEAIGFTGPAMAEYKVDRRSGKAYLMEINGRFWGSVLLASAAGLDLPYLLWKMLNGIEISPGEKHYRVGVRGRNLIGDSKSLMLSLKGKPAGWPGEMADRTAAVTSYLKSFVDRQTSELILTWDDPLPFVGRLMQATSS